MDLSDQKATLQGSARMPLCLLRVATGYFMALWAIEKLVKPEGAVGIFKFFYGMEISSAVAAGVGVVQLLIIVAFILGYRRRISYGLVFLMHGVSTLATWQHLLDPFGLYLLERPQHLFFAAVPVLAGTWLLYALRDWDTLTLDHRLQRTVAAED